MNLSNLPNEFNPAPKPQKRKMAIVKCTGCGIEFEKRKDQVNRRNLKNYCTNSCAGKHNSTKGRSIPSMKTGKTISCVSCGKDFYVIKCRLAFNPKFCSLACRGKFQQARPLPKGFITSADNKGSKNGRFKHGNRVGGHISKKKLRLAVIERDGHWCLYCGKPGPGLHLHRVEYGSQCGKYELDNCVQLCNVHHEVIHSNKTIWQPILLKYLSGREGRKWFEAYQEKYLIPKLLEEAK